VFTHSQIAPRGFPSLPASDNDITEKFCALTEKILPKTEADALIERIFDLEHQADVNFLFRALSKVA
jgi:hypothetical protein